jgi:glycosyltransferase involved in cell wall biosynthesis
MKFTVIIPVYNEIEWIKDFLTSIYNQSRKPDEIILVDGKSNDGTLEYLKNEEKKWKIKVFSFKCNVPEARNYAIKKTKNEIILCTDAWCIVDKNRSKEIMKIYETTDNKVVGWKSDYIIKSEFQKKVKNRIMPIRPEMGFISSRNISFYKKVWYNVWWYPENLKWWEDTYFNYIIEKAGYKIFFCKTAIVKRCMWKNYKDFYKMYRNYTQWDTEAFIIYNVIQSPSIKQAVIFLLFGVFLIVLLFVLKWYSIIAYLIILLMIWLYKRSGGGFIFDLQFSLAKMTWMTVGFIKWIIKWLKIKNKK